MKTRVKRERRRASSLLLTCLAALFGCGSPRGQETKPAPSAGEVEIADANRECLEGKGARCFQLAQILERRATLNDASPENAIHFYHQACRLDDVAGCLRLGEIFSTDEYLLKRPEQALGFFKAACERGAARACVRLGLSYENGEGVARSFEKAIEHYNQACRAGEAAGCDSARRLSAVPEPSASPPRSPEELTLLTCEGGGVDACIRVGESYETGGGRLLDLERAAQYYRKLCRLSGDDARGCNKASRLYRSTAWPGRDPAVAAQYSQRACDRLRRDRVDLERLLAAAALDGCKDLARMYAHGEGVPRDLVRAAELFSKTCSVLDPEGCYEAGLLYRRGEGVPIDAARAIALFKTACQVGEPRGCAAVGR
jgi:hypothetical protein